MEKSIFSRIHRFQHTSYADTKGMRENGYEGMRQLIRDDNQLISLWRDILSQGSLLAI